MKTRAELKKEYKETPVPMGVFLVRNTLTNEFIMQSTRNLEGALNKYKFVLKMGNPNDLLFKNPKIVGDYKSQGEASFEFKILDALKPKEEAGWDPGVDLLALEKLWMDELTGRGWKPY